MPSLSRICLYTLLLALLPGITGCVKLKQTLTVMPDGAGKVQLRFGLSEQLVALAQENEEDPFKEVLPEVMKTKTRGIVAFTPPTRETKDGFRFLTYQMYFPDINQIRIEGLGEGKPAVYQFEKTDAGYTLSITSGVTLSLIRDYEPIAEHERDDARKAMAGLSFEESFILPGKVKPVDGLATNDNTAQLKLTLDDLIEGTGPFEKFKDTRKLTLSASPESGPDEQAIAAFQKEMQQAVAAWEKSQSAPPAEAVSEPK